jgi:hypothetical protein
MPSEKKKSINYTSRDFNSIKSDLVDYAKKYSPDTYQDFSETGFGSLMLDTVSYVGDILSFYLDYQANESYLRTAIEYDNVVRHARQLGYRLNKSPSSYGMAAFYIIVPATTSGPNKAYAPILKQGSALSSDNGTRFTLTEDVDFADEKNNVVVAEVNDTTGLPTSYAIQAYGQVVSGRLAEETVEVGSYERFRKIQLAGVDIAEIVSIEDSEGNEYFEVENLSQNVIFRSITNTNSEDREQTPYLLQPRPYLLQPRFVSRRFTTERERNITTIQFGSGDESSDKSSAFSEPSSVVVFSYGKDYVSDTAIDPTRLIDSSKFGVAPSNTTLRVRYRINSSAANNVAAGGLSRIETANFSFENENDLSEAITQTVTNSIEVNNEAPIVGNVSLPTSEEIKIRSLGMFSTQHRAVTREDYINLTYAMPERFGAVKRVNVIQDNKSFKRNLNLYVTSEDEDSKLVQSNQSLKTNLKTWLNKNKMISDSIDILDAKIVNFGIEFEAIGEVDQDNFDLLSDAVNALSEKFTKTYDISENIYISDIYSTLKEVDGILDVTSAKAVLKVGGEYSDVFYDFQENLSADGRMIDIPNNVIVELKLPEIDIKGVIR